MKILKFPLIILLIAMSFACSKEFPGVDPPKNELFFPTGGLISPNQKTLFITNGNSDLKYNGSTLMALDLEKIMESVLNPSDSQYCKTDPSSQGEFLCELSSDFVLSAVRLDSFAGQIVKIPAKQGSDAAYRLIVPVRSSSSLVWFDVFTDENGQVNCLDCGAGCSASFPSDCDSSHKVTGLPSDPFRIYFDETDGYLLVTHLSDESITVIDVLADSPEVVQILGGAMIPGSGGSGGSYDIIEFDGSYYISNSSGSEIVRLSFVNSPEDDYDYAVLSGAYYFQAPSGPFESVYSVRGLALSSDKTKLYAAIKTPPMLLSLDLTNDPDTGKPSLDVLSQTEIPIQPSLIRTFVRPDGLETVIVISYPEGEMIVTDPETGALIQYVHTGVGPYEMLRYNGDFDGFIVLNYGESTIAFIDASGSYLDRVGRMGEPNPVGN